MIYLERFEKVDFDRLIEWVQSEKSMVLFSGNIFNFPLTSCQLNSYLEYPHRMIYKVVKSGSDKIIGHAELNDINYKSRSARICRVLIGDKESRNRGYGQAIVTELKRIAFIELDLHRLDLGVCVFNAEAIKCYEKCGFHMEGVLRESLKCGEEYWSCYNMSILNNK